MAENDKQIKVNHYEDGTASTLRRAVVFTNLRFYQRSDVLYQLTREFCKRFLPPHGDRTVAGCPKYQAEYRGREQRRADFYGDRIEVAGRVEGQQPGTPRGLPRLPETEGDDGMARP